MAPKFAHLPLLVALSAGLIILGVAMLFFSGLTESDDEQLFAAQAQNYAVLKNFNALQLFGNERLRGVAPGSEPMHPLLGSFFYNFASFFQAGRLHGVLLTNAFNTALTAALLVWIAHKRGFSVAAALVCALLFGLGSFALPYATSFYREPPAGLMLIAALCCVEMAACTPNPWYKISWLAGAGIWFVMGVLCKVTLAALFPLVLAYILARRSEVLPGYLVWGALLLLPVGAIAAWLVAHSLLPEGTLARMNWGFVLHLMGALPDIKTDYFWRALCGLFVSPAKGLIWYAPGILLGWANMKCANSRKETLAAWGAAILLAAVHARAYNQNWVMVAWAARPLLPVLPWLALACLPALEFSVSAGSGRQWIAWGLVVTGFIIQIPRMFAGDAAYINWLSVKLGTLPGEAQAWTWDFSPLIHQWDLIGAVPYSNIAWLRAAREGDKTFWLAAMLAGLLIAGGVWILLRLVRNMRIGKCALLLLACLAVITPWIAIVCLRADPLYAPARADISESLDYLRKNAHQPDAILVDAYLSPLWLASFNRGAFETEWVGLPPPVESVRYADHLYVRLEETAALATRLAKPPARIWLLEECLSLADRGVYNTLLKTRGFTQLLEMFFHQNMPESGVCLTVFTIT